MRVPLAVVSEEMINALPERTAGGIKEAHACQARMLYELPDS
ncbi:MAG: hypothetical protein RIK87_14450 [Fuerstiella sp.]